MIRTTRHAGRHGSRLRAASGCVGIVACVAGLAAAVARADGQSLSRVTALVEGLFVPGRAVDAAARDAAEVRRQIGGLLHADGVGGPLLVAAEQAIEAARLLSRLAAWHAIGGRPDTAERLYREANLVLADRAAGSPTLAENLHALALIAEAAGRHDEAETMFGESLAAVGTGGHARECRRDLARLLVRRRKFAPAARVVAEVEADSGMDTGQFEDAWGRRWVSRDALPFVSVRLDRAVLEAARGDEAAALRAMDEGRRAMRLWLNQELRLRSMREQLAMIAGDDALGLDTCLALGLHCADDADAARLSAAWLANGKAAAAEAAADRLRSAQRDADENLPGARQTLDRLQRVQRQLAMEVLLGPPDADAAGRRRLAELEEEEGRLSERLGFAANVNRADDATWVELDAIRDRIPAGAVLCDIARFRMRNFASATPNDDWAPARYAAWIVPPAATAAVTVIDLGPAAAIDAAVAEWRGQLHAAPGPQGRIVAQGEARAEAGLAKAGRALARLVLDPLLAAVPAGTNELIVVPDGPLWLVSWAALPLEDGRYAIEAYALRHLAAARDLVSRGVPPAAGGPRPARPLILAAPDFDRGRPPGGVAGGDRGATAAAGRLLPRVAALPGTEREAALVAPSVAQALESDTDVATEEDATERRFLSTPRPAAVVLATHGFFLAAPKRDGGGVASNLLRSAGLPVDATLDVDPLLANPLARCGILLAGANAAGRDGDGDDDGILTGLEIAGCDLRGTRLVVLSACDTAVGVVTDGEGVAGLRQAFHLAGAETVVATLWPIPDAETVGLMKEMFARLAKGGPPARALREAQLAAIAARRDLIDAAHPVMWAAFTVTGRGAP
jgi:CHAT domain-containing protein